MPNIYDLYPSKFLRAEDLAGQDVLAVIDRLEIPEPPEAAATVGDGEGEDDRPANPVLHFSNLKKALGLNWTNARTIARAYGENFSEWTGKEIILYPTETNFRGKAVPCIRLRFHTAVINANDLGL